ncbi:protein ABSCISIC ACID-INSENSITIVE 5, partial [Argentina anserina]|uniref:protein ABSCISIC ACID-INSENSITIVE 5 n=1 Tax=Argentina anserina TaxID=57926 RepID=UPI0021764E25
TGMGGVSESEMMSHSREDSPLQSDQHGNKNNQLFTSLGRQSSIYSLTLDEFQHALCENGKNFGSMNMDEFLNSIWTAEENQAINSTHHNHSNNIDANRLNNISNSNVQHLSLSEISTEKKGMIAKQPSLARQGSLTLPPPLCRKTVDEVWSEIHKGQKAQAQQQQNSNHNKSNDGAQNSEYAVRQPTFGEITLEDFLVKAGVVREPDSLLVSSLPPQSQQQQYGMVGQSFMMGMGANANANTCTTPVLPNYQTIPQSGGAVGESSGYATNGKRNGAFPPPPSQGVCFSGRMVNGGSGYAPTQPIGMATPVSPVSSDEMCANQIDNSGGQYGMDMGALRGRKRIVDGPVEKVVERRQRRMIKNRESAARSRARKQAYTVELEAELNQLREENANLKQALAELEMKRKQQYCEEVRKRAQSRAQKAMEKLWMLKRSHSCAV